MILNHLLPQHLLSLSTIRSVLPKIEEKRKNLIKEYKQILNKSIEVPKLLTQPRKQNIISKETANLQSLRKAYSSNINEIEKKVNTIVTQRKVISYAKSRKILRS